ncbi:hypothetical protein CBD41_02315 [bacterium TMED181]|nr:hypothetical protein [Planctomycetota bacterium]OUW46598.1 MAG: hypothetical protein CBD41_02315 [bacterium TMED181]
MIDGLCFLRLPVSVLITLLMSPGQVCRIGEGIFWKISGEDPADFIRRDRSSFWGVILWE